MGACLFYAVQFIGWAAVAFGIFAGDVTHSAAPVAVGCAVGFTCGIFCLLLSTKVEKDLSFSDDPGCAGCLTVISAIVLLLTALTIMGC
jgi:hypothetical protein